MGEKLFGFRLVDASALLLFISAVGMLVLGVLELYIIVEYYNATGEIPPAHFIVFIVTMSFSLYILYKTLTFKKQRKINK